MTGAMEIAMDNDDGGVLYRGGRVRTADPAMPVAEAVATRSGRILAVGSEQSCRSVLALPEEATGRPGAPSERVVDLAGRTLLPGLIDTETQPLVACFYALQVDLSGLTQLSDVLDALADRARTTPPGEWVIGLRLLPEQLAERRLPTVAELDAVGSGRPVVLVLGDCHTSIGNSLALAAAGILGRREDPQGGCFERDQHGQLTGVCQETATAVLMSAMPIPDLEELRSAAKVIFADLSAHGITSIGAVLQTDAEGLGGAARQLESVAMMILARELSPGLHAILCGNPARAADMRTSMSLHDPRENRHVGGVKLYVDGTLHARTAWMHEPYSDRPGARGLLRMDWETVSHRMEQAHLAGLQVCVHAVGDAALTQVLDRFADLLQRHPPDPAQPPRHRVEHVSLVDDAARARVVELGLVAVVQPQVVRRGPGWLRDRLGPERAQRAFPFRTLMDAGVMVAGCSACPMEPADALAGIAAAVTRNGLQPDEALTPAQAVDLYTRNAAIAQRRDGEAGTVTEGKRADLVVLSDDPATVPPERIAEIEVCQTVIGGKVVYRSCTP